jgi:hypothetical protein
VKRFRLSLIGFDYCLYLCHLETYDTIGSHPDMYLSGFANVCKVFLPVFLYRSEPKLVHA